MEKKYRILVVRYDTIGDTVFSLPFYRELKNFYKDNCIIDVITDYQYKYILENCPYINNLIFIEKLNVITFLKYFFMFRKYNKIYFLRKCSGLSLISFLAGVKDRIGFNVKGNVHLNKKIFYDESKHIVDLYFDLLRIDDIPVNNIKIDNIFNNLEKNTLISNKFVAIQAISRSHLKNWNNEKWKKVLFYITNELNLEVVLLGSKKDYKKYELIVKDNIKIHNLSGKLDFKDSVSLIKDSEFLIGIDSGLMHIAAVLNKKSILLSGATSLKHWAPLNDKCVILSKADKFECSPCIFSYHKKTKKICPDVPKCMDAISAEDVIDKINFILNKT